MKPQTEDHADLVNIILDYLAAIDIMAWKSSKFPLQTTGHIFGKPKKMRPSTIEGILPRGQFLAIGVHCGNSLPTTSQLRFFRAIKARHGMAFFVQSLDDLQHRLSKAGLLPGSEADSLAPRGRLRIKQRIEDAVRQATAQARSEAAAARIELQVQHIKQVESECRRCRHYKP